jgi:hypothetical protein
MRHFEKKADAKESGNADKKADEAPKKDPNEDPNRDKAPHESKAPPSHDKEKKKPEQSVSLNVEHEASESKHATKQETKFELKYKLTITLPTDLKFGPVAVLKKFELDPSLQVVGERKKGESGELKAGGAISPSITVVNVEEEKKFGFGILDMDIGIKPKAELSTSDKPSYGIEGEAEFRYRKNEKGPFFSFKFGGGVKWGDGTQGYFGGGISTGVLF